MGQQLGQETVQLDATPRTQRDLIQARPAECGNDANILPLTTLSVGGPLDANSCDARMSPYLSAPIAQLAEQLTLNQLGDSAKPLTSNTLGSRPLERAAPGAAVEHENAPTDPDLQAIVERWPDLPEAVKSGIVAMVHATGK